MNDTFCPPSAPPPAPPPDFAAWSAVVPTWFWAIFAFMSLVSVVGVVSSVYVVYTLRRSRRFANDSFGTRMTLAALESRIEKAEV